jgi:hypothetical protein
MKESDMAHFNSYKSRSGDGANVELGRNPDGWPLITVHVEDRGIRASVTPTFGQTVDVPFDELLGSLANAIGYGDLADKLEALISAERKMIYSARAGGRQDMEVFQTLEAVFRDISDALTDNELLEHLGIRSHNDRDSGARDFVFFNWLVDRYWR